MKRQASDSVHPMVRRSQKTMKMDPDFVDAGPDSLGATARTPTSIAQRNGVNGVTSGTSNGMNTTFIDNLKEEANRLYGQRNYDAAILKYTMLIALCPNTEIYYGNRAACYMMQEHYDKALADAKKSVEINPNFVRGHCRTIKCALMLHEFPEMDASVGKLQEIDPTNEVLKYQSDKMTELVQHLRNEVAATAVKDYATALTHIDKSIEICPFFLAYRMKKAECLVELGRLGEAEGIATEVLKKDKINSEAHWVLGMCLYQRDVEQSLEHFKKCFILCPESDKNRDLYKKAKAYTEQKTQGNEAYKSQNFSKAYELYTKALGVDPSSKIMQGTLYFNKAQASYKLGQLQRCLEECGKTLAYIPNHVRALMRRAQCHLDRRDYEGAIEDLQKASSIESSAEVIRMLSQARRLLEASRNDFHAILGVSSSASEQEIKKAYKDLTKKHHPDRHANATDDEKKYHEKKCKDITRAYRSLMERVPSASCNNNCYREEQRRTSTEQTFQKARDPPPPPPKPNNSSHSSQESQSDSNDASDDDFNSHLTDDDFDTWGEEADEDPEDETYCLDCFRNHEPSWKWCKKFYKPRGYGKSWGNNYY